MPSIADAWEAAAAAQCSRALAAAWDAYGSAMRETVVLPMDEPVLLAAHESALDRAGLVFTSAAPSGAEVAVDRHRSQLKARAAEAFASTKARTAASACTNHLLHAVHLVLPLFCFAERQHDNFNCALRSSHAGTHSLALASCYGRISWRKRVKCDSC
jgi:hypothetical protein